MSVFAQGLVFLAVEPLGEVTISVNDPSSPQIRAEPSTLTFGEDNWNEPQQVTVYTGQDDDLEDETDEVTHGLNVGDDGSMDLASVTVTVRDDDSDCGGPDIWCATVEFADQSATDWGIYRLFYHRSSEPASSLSDVEFVYGGRVHTITNMYLSPGIPPDSDSPPTGRETEWSTFFISVLPGRWGQVPDTGVPETDYLNWTLHIGGVELPFRESGGPTRSDGRRGTFVWRGQAVQGLFSEWPVPTTYEVRIEETPYSGPVASPPTTPGAPRYLRVVPQSAGSLWAVWRAPTSDGGSEVTGYKVQWKKAPDSWKDPDAVSEIGTAPTDALLISESITGLIEGVDYSVRVIASNDVGPGSPSEEYPGRPQPHTPSMTVATVDGAALELTFDTPLDGGSVPGADGFEVLVNHGIRTVTDVAVKGNIVRLTLSSAVSPADEAHVRHLPPTDLEGPAIRYTDGNLAISQDMFGFSEVSNRTDLATLSPLTAGFVDIPASHNGADSFTFRIRFSESVWVRRGDTRADVLEVVGGTVTNGWWLDRHTGMWEFTVLPDSGADVTIVLPAGRGCDTTGAPCASGDRRLSNRLEITVHGPDS